MVCVLLFSFSVPPATAIAALAPKGNDLLGRRLGFDLGADGPLERECEGEVVA